MVTGDDGGFRFEVKPGSYALSATAYDFAAAIVKTGALKVKPV